jgi:hypothetical protein
MWIKGRMAILMIDLFLTDNNDNRVKT